MPLDPHKVRRVANRVLVSAIAGMALYGYARFSIVDYPRGCDAMAPTLSTAGSRLVIDRYPDHARPMRHLDVIVYDHPGLRARLVGRVRAMPGDEIALAAGKLAIAGASTERTPGAIPLGSVPSGTYVVLNENPDSTYPDSRVHGLIPAARIAGRMIASLPGSGQ